MTDITIQKLPNEIIPDDRPKYEKDLSSLITLPGVVKNTSTTDIGNIVLSSKVLSKYLTQIEASAFMNGTKGTAKIDACLPNVSTIGASAFANYKNLNSLDLPNLVSYGTNPFSGCSLSSLTLGSITDFHSSPNIVYDSSISQLRMPNVSHILSTGYSTNTFTHWNSVKALSLDNCTIISEGNNANGIIASQDGRVGCIPYMYLSSFYAPKVSCIYLAYGNYYGWHSTALKTLDLPAVTDSRYIRMAGFGGVQNMKLDNCTILSGKYARKGNSTDSYIFPNTTLLSCIVPKVQQIEDGFFLSSKNLTWLDVSDQRSQFCLSCPVDRLRYGISLNAQIKYKNGIEKSLKNTNVILNDAIPLKTGLKSLNVKHTFDETNTEWEYDPDTGDRIYYTHMHEYTDPIISSLYNTPIVFWEISSIYMGLDCPCKSIGSYAFYNGNVFSLDVQNLTSIGDYAFWGNGMLYQVSAPKCKQIGTGAFIRCQNIGLINLDIGILDFYNNLKDYGLDKNTKEFVMYGNDGEMTIKKGQIVKGCLYERIVVDDLTQVIMNPELYSSQYGNLEVLYSDKDYQSYITVKSGKICSSSINATLPFGRLNTFEDVGNMLSSVLPNFDDSYCSYASFYQSNLPPYHQISGYYNCNIIFEFGHLHGNISYFRPEISIFDLINNPYTIPNPVNLPGIALEIVFFKEDLSYAVYVSEGSVSGDKFLVEEDMTLNDAMSRIQTPSNVSRLTIYGNHKQNDDLYEIWTISIVNGTCSTISSISPKPYTIYDIH